MTVRDRLEAIEADITTLEVDAIVNAANALLLGGGGVDGAIRRKAGSEIDIDLHRIGGCEEGEAVITPGHKLPATYVIHTVAPFWEGGLARASQERIFARCYESALTLADANRIRTIAFPGIGTGIFRWPVEIASRIAFNTVVAHLKRCAVQTKVTFCCFSRSDHAHYAELLANSQD